LKFRNFAPGTALAGTDAVMQSAKSQVWAVVLAGGAGEPARLVDTLGRVALEIPPERTVVVMMRSHAHYFFDHRERGESFLVQPDNRGTAASILLPIHWIRRRDPDAVVVVFPTDQVVSDEPRFMAQVARMAAWVRRNSRRIVLLGAPASSAEQEYGWIERGQSIGCSDDDIAEVEGFWEKPSCEQAQACLDAGCLWNTLVLVGTVGTFLRAARVTVPAMEERLRCAERFLDTELEAGALCQAYALMRTACFSRAVLQRSVPMLAVAQLTVGVLWSDLGHPRLALDVLHRRAKWPKEPGVGDGGR
jgi:mannose-1-phosphate guanylyltransferase